jgi:hypothetical protein
MIRNFNLKLRRTALAGLCALTTACGDMLFVDENADGRDDRDQDGGVEATSVEREPLTAKPVSGDWCGDGQNGHAFGSLYHWSTATLRWSFVRACPNAACGANRDGQNDACVAAQTPAEVAIAGAARAGLGNSPASTLTGNAALGGATWFTDVAGGDGARLRNAFIIYNGWAGARANGALTHAVPAVGSATYVAMANALAATYTWASDRDAIIRRISAVFDDTPPVGDQATLDEVRIRKQCKEWVDTRVQSVGRPSASYATYRTRPVTRRSDIVPGKAIIKTGDSHIAIIVGVARTPAGLIDHVTVIESNWANAFHNPAGALPWARQVTQRDIPLADLERLYVTVTL